MLIFALRASVLELISFMKLDERKDIQPLKSARSLKPASNPAYREIRRTQKKHMHAHTHTHLHKELRQSSLEKQGNLISPDAHLGQYIISRITAKCCEKSFTP